MANHVRQVNTSNHPVYFLMVSSTDGVTGVAGATITMTISKDGGPLASPVGTVTSLGGGLYVWAGNATDRNTLGTIGMHITAAGCNATDETCEIVAYDPYSATDLGLSSFGTIFNAISSAATIATAVWNNATRVITGNSDKTGYALTSAYDAAKTAASESNATANKQAILDWLTANMPTLVQIAGAIATAVSGLATTLQLTSAKDEILDAVDAIDGGGGGGDTISINIPPAVAVASQDPAFITMLRGDTLSITLPLMGTLTSRTALVFTVKASTDDTDAQAILQVSENGGLLRVNGDAATAGDGALTVLDASTGEVSVRVNASVMATMSTVDFVWDAQVTTSTSVSSPISGIGEIVADVTRTLS